MDELTVDEKLQLSARIAKLERQVHILDNELPSKGLQACFGDLCEDYDKLDARLRALEQHHKEWVDYQATDQQREIGQMMDRLEALEQDGEKDLEWIGKLHHRLLILEQQRQPCENRMQEMGFLMQALSRFNKNQTLDEETLAKIEEQREHEATVCQVNLNNPYVKPDDPRRKEWEERLAHVQRSLTPSYACQVCGSSQKCDCAPELKPYYDDLAKHLEANPPDQWLWSLGLSKEDMDEPDERTFRKTLSGKMQELGDRIMTAYRERRGES